MPDISGTVTDGNGNPVENAEIYAIDESTPPDATTDANGNFTVTKDGGTYHVTAHFEDETGYQNAYSKPGITLEASELLIEDFESGNLSAYNTATGSQDTSNTTVVTDQVYEGTYALEHLNNNWVNFISDSLPNLPSRGDTIRWHCYAQGDMSARIQYGLQSATNRDNCYNCKFDVRDQQFVIEARSGGTGSVLVSDTTTPLPANEWCRIEVQWLDDGTGNTEITATCWDSTGTQITSISVVDTTHNYTTGAFGWGLWGSSTTTRVLVDYATIL